MSALGFIIASCILGWGACGVLNQVNSNTVQIIKMKQDISKLQVQVKDLASQQKQDNVK